MVATFRQILRPRMAAVWTLVWPALVLAAVYTAAQIADAVRNSPSANAWLRANADAIGNLAVRVESGGDTAAYNGSCCSGVLQMNTTNIWTTTRLTPAQYRALDLQSQVNAWAQLTSPLVQSSAVQQLIRLDTFDGRQVDANLVLACMQLDVGNCQRMISSGRCSGFADSNGTTICAMADRMGGAGAAAGGTGSGNPGGAVSSGGYIPDMPCKRDAGGSCLSISEALEQGYARGSGGVTMARTKSTLYAAWVAVVLFILGSISLGAWKRYYAGAMSQAQLVVNMKRIALAAAIFVLAISYA